MHKDEIVAVAAAVGCVMEIWSDVSNVKRVFIVEKERKNREKEKRRKEDVEEEEEGEGMEG